MRNSYWMILAGATLCAAPSAATAQDPAAVAEGAKVWAQNCTRCHNARASTERTDRDWFTIVAHMRARANLTRSQATAVATFLTATNEPIAAPSSPENTAPADSATAAAAKVVIPTTLTPEQRKRLLAYLARIRQP